LNPATPLDFERVYKEHKQGLYALALSVTRRPDQAEDAVHDAFTRIFRTKREPTGDYVAYVYACVRNAAIDKIRKRKHAQMPEAMIFESDAMAPQQMLEISERDQRLQDAITQLPSHEKQVIIMKIYGQLTFEQIAQANDQPLATVASRYRRTLAKLKDILEAQI